MFNITEAMKTYWQEHPKPKANDTDIALIESSIGFSLAKPYKEFVRQYGFVIFGNDSERRERFNYVIHFPDRQELREGRIAVLKKTEEIIKSYQYFTMILPEEDLPKFPANFLPIGDDLGQGRILLELGDNAGRVWYWTAKDWAWGTEDNTWLGFVADDFYEFINKLHS